MSMDLGNKMKHSSSLGFYYHSSENGCSVRYSLFWLRSPVISEWVWKSIHCLAHPNIENVIKIPSRTEKIFVSKFFPSIPMSPRHRGVRSPQGARSPDSSNTALPGCGLSLATWCVRSLARIPARKGFKQHSRLGTLGEMSLWRLRYKWEK